MKRALAILALLAATTFGARGETLYNGIVLPTPWPPSMDTATQTAYANHQPPPRPAWLVTPPAVIPIDVGRQLFVDDFLIADTTLTKTQHGTTACPTNPVVTGIMTFSDGVWYDPAGPGGATYTLFGCGYGTQKRCTSTNGINWTPSGGTSIGLASVSGGTDSAMCWMDLETTDASQRWKYSRQENLTSQICVRYTSSTGTAFSSVGSYNFGGADRTTFFYNPFRKKWVWSIRSGVTDTTGSHRARAYKEVNNWVTDSPSGGVFWCACDNLDPVSPRNPGYGEAEMYNLDANAYESVMISMWSIIRGRDYAAGSGPFSELDDVCVGFSRDGWYWERPNRNPVCPLSNTSGDFNYTNVQSAGGCGLVVDDKIYIYAQGRTKNLSKSVGMWSIRRDGFTSVDAAMFEGTLTTRTVKFSGKYMFVNVDDAAGSLQAEIIDESGNVIAPFSKDNCTPVSVDSTRKQVTWSGASDMTAVANRNVKIKFYLTNGRLYSFWVSPSTSGASNGYVLAGGPGFTSNKDTVGGGTGGGGGGGGIVYGDANGDGIFGMADVNQMVDWLLSRSTPPAVGVTAFTRSDVNGDNTLSMADLNLFVDKLLGRIAKFPVEP
jgi:hypothetical protein